MLHGAAIFRGFVDGRCDVGDLRVFFCSGEDWGATRGASLVLLGEMCRPCGNRGGSQRVEGEASKARDKCRWGEMPGGLGRSEGITWSNRRFPRLQREHTLHDQVKHACPGADGGFVCAAVLCLMGLNRVLSTYHSTTLRLSGCACPARASMEHVTLFPFLVRFSSFFLSILTLYIFLVHRRAFDSSINTTTPLSSQSAKSRNHDCQR